MAAAGVIVCWEVFLHAVQYRDRQLSIRGPGARDEREKEGGTEQRATRRVKSHRHYV